MWYHANMVYHQAIPCGITILWKARGQFDDLFDEFCYMPFIWYKIRVVIILVVANYITDVCFITRSRYERLYSWPMRIVAFPACNSTSRKFFNTGIEGWSLFRHVILAGLPTEDTSASCLFNGVLVALLLFPVYVGVFYKSCLFNGAQFLFTLEFFISHACLMEHNSAL